MVFRVGPSAVADRRRNGYGEAGNVRERARAADSYRDWRFAYDEDRKRGKFDRVDPTIRLSGRTGVMRR